MHKVFGNIEASAEFTFTLNVDVIIKWLIKLKL